MMMIEASVTEIRRGHLGGEVRVEVVRKAEVAAEVQGMLSPQKCQKGISIFHAINKKK